MEIKEKVQHLMDTAEYEAISVFDRCIIVVARLENDVMLAESHVFEDCESFSQEKGVEMCLKKIADQVWAMETAEPIELTEYQARVIAALAENKIVVTDAARQLNFHRNSVVYHIGKIREATGKDPMNFFDLCELLMAANKVLKEAE